MNKIRDFSLTFQPRRFSEIAGYEEHTAILKRFLLDKTLPTGILFTGDTGVGKSVLAMILARAAACLGRKDDEFEPCGKCEACRKGCSRETFFYRVGSAIKDADEFREHVQWARAGASTLFNDTRRRYPIVIDELQDASPAVQKDLRRQLQEPWGRAVLIATRLGRIDEPLRKRMHNMILIPPRKPVLVEWIIGICKRAGIKVEDPGSAGIIVDKARSEFRTMLFILERMYVSDLPLNDENARKACAMCGYP